MRKEKDGDGLERDEICLEWLNLENNNYIILSIIMKVSCKIYLSYPNLFITFKFMKMEFQILNKRNAIAKLYINE